MTSSNDDHDHNHDHEFRLSSLDRQRAHLESALYDLQNSLYYWRTWEAEYDGLGSALSAPRDDGTDGEDGETGDGSQRRYENDDEGEDMLATALEFISAPLTSSDGSGSGGGSSSDDGAKSVLTPSEADDIIYGTRQRNNTNTGDVERRSTREQKQARSRAQVLSLLDRRIDYVRENERVLEQRVERAQRDLDGFMDVVPIADEGGSAEGNDRKEGGGLPVTEIVEELDEAGSVVRGDTVRAGESAMELLDVLKRAGVKEVDGGGGGRITEAGEDEEGKDVKNKVPDTAAPTLTAANTITSGSASDMVSNDASVSNVSTSGWTRPSLEAEAHVETRHNTKMQNGVVTEVDESPEDAALRREMLQYGLEEVGAVVAELELDDSGSEASVDDEEEKELYDYIMGGGEDDEEGEDEDEYGRTTQRMIDDDYHRQMLDLERKLNAKGLRNMGPDVSSLPTEVREELDGERVSSTKVELGRGGDGGKKEKKAKKRVVFAEDVDIAPDPSSAVPQVETRKQKRVESPEVTTIQEHVIERAQGNRANGDVSGAAKPAKKASRFRSARQAQESTPSPTPTPASKTTATPRAQQQPPPPRPQPAGSTQGNGVSLFPATPSEPKPFSQPIIYPDDSSSSASNAASSASASKKHIVSDTLVERPPSSNSPVAAEAPNAPDPDDFDEAMLNREVTMEYYRLRNRKIQQQGGFVRSPEEDEEEHDEETFAPIDEGRKKVSRFKAARVGNNAFS